MRASSDNTAAKGLRERWLTSPRHGMRRLINAWACGHLRAFGVMHIAGGSVAAVVCLRIEALP